MTKNTGNAGKGRPKGSKNKVTTLLRDAVVQAAEAVGQDGKGKEGLVGYLKDLAVNEKKAFATLMGRAMPMQIAGTDEDGEPTAITITYVNAND